MSMSLSLEAMIDGFRFYVEERQIGLALLLAEHFRDPGDKTPFKQSGYVILSIATAYFEMIQQFIEGKESVQEESSGRFVSRSWDFFRNGFKNVYPDSQWTEDKIKRIYKAVRCGMYHGGMPKTGCHLSRYFRPGIHLCGDEIHINPSALAIEIRQHFEKYVHTVRVDPEAQAKFVAMCCVMGLDREPATHTYCCTPEGNILTLATANPHAKGDERYRQSVETER